MLQSPMMWFIGGLILCFAELFVPGIFLVFPGMSALIVAILLWCMPLNILAAVSIFIVLTVVLALLFWRKLGGRKVRTNGIDDEFCGRVGIITSRVAPPAFGRVRIGDIEWDAKSDTILEAGTNVVVKGYDNLTMNVVENVRK